MATRRPVQWPFAIVRDPGGAEHPALILGWVHGRKGQPTDWFAEVVINSTNDPGRPVEMLVHSDQVRQAGRT